MQVVPYVRPRAAPTLDGPVYKTAEELEGTVKWLENLHKVGLVVAVPLLAWIVWKVNNRR